jgi:low temperature requirement protein LtrA
VMAGMGHQEAWSLAAASAAILGMALIFTIWWWYFDGVEAAAERRVATMGDAVRFQVWSYAHLPLYLGIAVTGVGVEHVITSATMAPLAPGEARILCGAAATVMIAMTIIGATGARHAPRVPLVPAASLHVLLAAAALALGTAGGRLIPPVLVAGLTSITVAQLLISIRARA